MPKYEIGYTLTGFTEIEAKDVFEATELLAEVVKKEGISLNQYVLEMIELNHLD